MAFEPFHSGNLFRKILTLLVAIRPAPQLRQVVSDPRNSQSTKSATPFVKSIQTEGLLFPQSNVHS